MPLIFFFFFKMKILSFSDLKIIFIPQLSGKLPSSLVTTFKLTLVPDNQQLNQAKPVSMPKKQSEEPCSNHSITIFK